MLVNTVVGFIGPEYLYDGKQIARAGLEDHFCGKLLGLPMGCDVCYTNHAEADQDDMDALLTLLGAAGVNYIMGVPGADDVMLNYQSTSFHDALYLRRVLGLRPAPEFEAWLAGEDFGRLQLEAGDPERLLRHERPCPARPSPPRLRALTPARVGLGRTGVSQQTRDVLISTLPCPGPRCGSCADWIRGDLAGRSRPSFNPLLPSGCIPPLRIAPHICSGPIWAAA